MISEFRELLHRMLAEQELARIPLLVFANKQDLPGPLSAEDITRRLGLNNISSRVWHVQECSAVRDTGLEGGFDWLAQVLEGLNRST
jgi:signal recognition particle receptor subunit beta